jgi:hypothetical protein
MADRIIISPNSRRQEELFAASEDEILYGGAAGGGKTWAIVMDPVRYVAYSKFTGIIFRRTYPELEGSVMPTAWEIYPYAGGVYVDQKKTWRFPSGASIRMGFMEHKEHWRKYQGHQYCYQGFDELTNFLLQQFRMIHAWNRSKQEGIRAYRRAASNPGGVGHSWVKEYFVEPCPQQKDGPERYSEVANIHWQPYRPGPTFAAYNDRTRQILTRKFIPSRVFDNEDLLRNNPQYLATLLGLPPDQRRALLEGDWDVYEGMFFERWRNEIHELEYFQRAESWPVIGAIDYGNETVLEVATKDYHGNIVYFVEHYTKSKAPEERADAMADVLLQHELHNIKIIYDTNMDYALPYYPGGQLAPIKIFRDIFQARMGKKAPRLVVVSKHSTDKRNYRVVTNEAFKNHLNWQRDEEGKLSKKPKLYVYRKGCPRLCRDIPQLVHDPDSEEGMDFIHDGDVDDHTYDAAKMVLMELKTPVVPSTMKSWVQKFRERSPEGAQLWVPGMG